MPELSRETVRAAVAGGRRAPGHRRRPCLARSSPRSRRPVPRRSGARRRPPRWRRCRPPPAGRGARSSGRAKRHDRRSAGGSTRPRRRRPESTSDGTPSPIGLDLGGRPADLLDGVRDDRRASRRDRPRAKSGAPGGGPRGPRRRHPPSSFVPPASTPITRRGGMAGRYTQVRERPATGRPPGLQGLPVAPQALRCAAAGGRPPAAPRALAQARRSWRAGAANAGTPTSISPGAIIRWAIFAVVGWIVLSLVLFMVSAQLEGGVDAEAEAALSGGSNFFTGSTVLVLGSDQRDGRLDRPEPERALPRRTRSCSCTRPSEACVSSRSRATLRPTSPATATQKINAAYALGGAALTIETVEAFLGNGLEINHLIEVDFQDFPAFIDALGGMTVNNKIEDLRARVRQLLQGLQPVQGRARARRPLGARLRARAQEPVRARRDRHRARRAPAGGARRDPRARCSPPAPSSACRL